MTPIVAFRRVKDAYGWMSNMSSHRVVHDGETYPSAEALFQSLRFDDPALRAEIRACRNPLAAKHKAYAHMDRMAITPRGAQDLEQMRLTLRLKLDQHPELHVELLSTGAALIIEDCTRRPQGSGLFWGAALQGDGGWSGENWLGKLWMEQRTRLVQDNQAQKNN